MTRTSARAKRKKPGRRDFLKRIYTFPISQCADGDCESKTRGTVTSPNYPLNYPIDKDVSYTLMVAEGSAIQLSFTSIEIEECPHDTHEGRCFCDYVRVLDTDGSQILETCGNELPADKLTSFGNKMTVVFHSDHSETFKGFSADWTMVDPPAPVTSGEIMSPNYPENYPDDLDKKEYPIRVAIGKRVELTIEDLGIESCVDCSECDHLEIYDTPVDGPPTLLDVSQSLKSLFYLLFRRCADRVSQAALTRAPATS